MTELKEELERVKEELHRVATSTTDDFDEIDWRLDETGPLNITERPVHRKYTTDEPEYHKEKQWFGY